MTFVDFSLISDTTQKEIIRRVTSRCKQDLESGCLLWQGPVVSAYGYGGLSYRGKVYLAHRLIYMAKNKILLGKRELVCHTCDTPPCCNTDHLFHGSHSDNARDAVSKGRMGVGELNGKAKLTWEEVDEIRDCYKRGWRIYVLAKRFNMENHTISNIVHNRSWIKP